MTDKREGVNNMQAFEILIKYKKKFESNFEKTNGCWKWIGAKNNKGYGQLSITNRQTLAHRISYSLYVGNIDKGLHVLHKCDVSDCVNPGHLFLGTHKDNMLDRNRKGRAKGGNNKLRGDQVIAIRKDLRRQSEIAQEYGINQSQVCRIKSQKVWRLI